MLMKTRFAPVDFNIIEPAHEAIHKRLENWARFYHDPRGYGRSAPMFKWYRADNYDRDTKGIPADGTDAQRIYKGVAALPEKHRIAINWFYAKPVNPRMACQKIGTSMEGLAQYVRDSRQMLINRRV